MLLTEQQQKCGCNTASFAVNMSVNSSLSFTVVSSGDRSMETHFMKATCLVAFSSKI
jgi:hypothetical protein